METSIQENNLWSLAGQVGSIRCAFSSNSSDRSEMPAIWAITEISDSLKKIGRHGPWNVWVKTDLPAG